MKLFCAVSYMCIINYLVCMPTGAFGVVYHSIYHNPVTGKDMDVAVKGLKG